jgi:hypothetical protein
VVSAAFLQFGIRVIAAAILALILWNVFSKGGRETLAICRDSLAEGAKTALPSASPAPSSASSSAP